MKKIFSLLLVALMLVSMVPTALAAEVGGNWGDGTIVTYSANQQESYTVTVPAELAPGEGGKVTLSGTWASSRTVKVTADAEVVLTNSINAADKKTLAVTFPGIAKAGDNTQAVSANETVSVAGIDNALFGTWRGKFNYYVDFEDAEPEEEMVTITLTRDYDGRNSGRVYIDGYSDRYMDGGSCQVDDNWGEWTSPTTIEVPVGTQIILETEYEDSYTKFVINGVSVYDDETDWTTYEYTVTKDATIAMTTEHVGQSTKYVMSITEG